jgi:hypothetical protein
LALLPLGLGIDWFVSAGWAARGAHCFALADQPIMQLAFLYGWRLVCLRDPSGLRAEDGSWRSGGVWGLGWCGDGGLGFAGSWSSAGGSVVEVAVDGGAGHGEDRGNLGDGFLLGVVELLS